MYLFIIFILTAAVPLVVMPRYIKQGISSPYGTVFNGALNTWFLIAFVFMLSSFSGQGIFAQLHIQVNDMIAMAVKNPAFSELPIFGELNTAEKTELLTKSYDEMLITLPAYIMALSAIISYAEYIILTNVLKKRFKTKPMTKFREFTLPPNAVMGIFLMYIASWAITMTGSEFGNVVYANINFIFNFVFTLQGISVVFMFCHMKRILKAVAVIAAILIWSNYIGQMLLTMLGLFDLIFGLKGRIQGGGRRKTL